VKDTLDVAVDGAVNPRVACVVAQPKVKNIRKDALSKDKLPETESSKSRRKRTFALATTAIEVVC